MKIYKKGNEIFSRKATGPLGPKEQLQMDKLREYNERIQKLNAEKVALAEDLRRLSARAIGRLEYDLLKIRRATGDLSAFAPEPVAAPTATSIPLTPTPNANYRSNPVVAAAIAASASNPSLAASIGTPVLPASAAAFAPQVAVQLQETVAVTPAAQSQSTAQKRKATPNTDYSYNAMSDAYHCPKLASPFY